MSNPNKIKDWINFPRSILNLLRDGTITGREYQVYMFMRHNCSPYGISVVNVSEVNIVIFGNDVEDNWVYKIMRSLRKKKLVWYSNRQGVRGSYRVHFGDFLMFDGNIRTLDKYFNPDDVRSNNNIQIEAVSDVSPEVENLSQRLEIQKSALKSHFSLRSKYSQVRSHKIDNDKENYNKTDTDWSALNSFNKVGGEKILVNGFMPKNSDESIILDIAKAVVETDMRFLLSVNKKHGLWIIEKAYGEYKENPLKDKIVNPPAYLNKIIQRLISEKEK